LWLGKAIKKLRYLTENQISRKYRYIESSQAIGINEIISDIKQIHATYLIFAVAVKSGSRKIGPWANKKVKFIRSDLSS
jgi:hypothetical protein